ncbi:MAG: Gfo/Idh/MocA family oxidoreductase [Planctomycetes bacterium]|nr:Gfo/Idh/MocA family oxidoreductase [Planctomycetota bacterium]MBI3834786.1 Gfo/Idh/MocA family oxidoreductase [Planctomycetota bacterium]
MPINPLRVAVIGAGHMGRHHARIYSETAGAKLVAIVDKDLARATPMAEQFGAKAVASADEISGEIDAATIAVPTVYHAEVAIPLMERGVHVLVEKPLAQNVDSARQLVEAARRTGRVLQVGHSERFNPVVQALIRMEVSPRFIETHRISPFTFRSADIGVVFDMMIHDIDIVLHLVRSTSCAVDAVGVNVLGKFEDIANARLRFDNQAVANLTASRLALKTERKIRVFCPTAYLSMDYQKKSGIAIKLADNVDFIRMARERNFEDLSQFANIDFGSLLKIEELAVDDVEPLRAEIQSFLDCVRSGESKGVTAEEGLAAVDLAERITKSVAEQAWGERLPIK